MARKLAKLRIKLSYFAGGCWQSGRNQHFFAGNARGHARPQSIRLGESRRGLIYAEKERRDVAHVTFYVKAKNEKINK